MAKNPSGKKTAQPKKSTRGRGRPSDYKPEYAEMARRFLLLKRGATNEDLAKLFGKNVDTIYEWQKVHSDFSDALRAGKDGADTEVANALHSRAVGAVWIEEVAFKVKTIEYDKLGRKTRESEKIEVAAVRRAAPPDTRACELWLNNRDPENWRQKPEPSDDDDVVNPVTVTVQVKDARRQADG